MVCKYRASNLCLWYTKLSSIHLYSSNSHVCGGALRIPAQVSTRSPWQPLSVTIPRQPYPSNLASAGIAIGINESDKFIFIHSGFPVKSMKYETFCKKQTKKFQSYYIKLYQQFPKSVPHPKVLIYLISTHELHNTCLVEPKKRITRLYTKQNKRHIYCSYPI